MAPDHDVSSFPVDFERAMQGLRGALTELLAALGEDPRLPQEISRRYGINKNLAWKVCKIINSTDAYSSAQHVPGLGGVKILLRALEKGGAPAEELEAVEAAMSRFERMVQVHVGDRANLDLYVASVQPGGVHSPQLEANRRMAYLGNSATWGVQARLGFTLRLVAPNAQEPERADLASVGGLLGFRRLRPTASWAVLRMQTLSENLEIRNTRHLPIDPGVAEDEPPLVREFCSDPLPSTRSLQEADTTTLELCEGPVGNTAALDVVFGTIDRALVPVSGDGDLSVGEHYCRLETPAETVQFDLLVHRDLPFPLPPKLCTYSLLQGKTLFPLSENRRFHLPGTSDVQELGGSPPVVASPLVPRYGRLVDLACERLGHRLADFRGFRMTLTYPPIPAVFVMHHELGAPRPR
ncbi:MAG: hypothetical protein H6828_02435 [Planctomycetes bacterium]|nr:hypothetical protein [Planctomycetota bacterium]